MKTSILLIGHGSKDPATSREFFEFVQKYRVHDSGGQAEDMDCAFLELSEPLIPEALNRMASSGAKKIIAVPYLLFSAGHVKTEIPGILREFRHSHPEIEVQYGDCLWPHDNLVELAKIRINETLGLFSASDRDQIDVLIVGRGATDPEAIAQFSEAVQKIQNEISCRSFRHCFIALAEPRYKDALPQMLQEGSRRILLFPFYLFTGILVERIKSQAKDLLVQYPDAEIKIAPYFGSHPLMFDMVKDKLKSKRGAAA